MSNFSQSTPYGVSANTTLNTTMTTAASAITDSCPLNRGFVPLDVLSDANICAAKQQDAYYRSILVGPSDQSPVPIGGNGERLYHWLPKGRSIEQRRAQPHEVGLHPDSWAPWTHRPVCAEKAKYCVFSSASIPGLAVGSTPEIVVNTFTPGLTDDDGDGDANIDTSSNTTLLTPQKNAMYNSKWDSLAGAFSDRELAYQGISILTTPEMAASSLHLHSFLLHPQALEDYDRFARLPSAYKIQRIPDLPDVKLVKSAEEVAEEVAEAAARKERANKAEALEMNENAKTKEQNENEFPDPDDDDDGAEGDDFGDIVIADDDDGSVDDADKEEAPSAGHEQPTAPQLPPDIQALINNGSRLITPRRKRPVELTSSTGWGAVAARDIRAGEPIIMERPVMIAHDTLFVAGDDDMAVHGSHLTDDEDNHGLGTESVAVRARLWQAMVDNLPPATAARVRSLHVLPKYRGDFEPRPPQLDAMNQTSSEYYDADYDWRNAASQLSRAEKAFDSNAFSMSIHGYPVKGLFPRTAILNHACRPNTVASWSELPLVMTVYARRDIGAGEELTIDYLGSGGDDTLTLKARTLLNGHRFGFKCQCALCRLQRADPDARRRSDDRRDRLKYELPSIVLSAISVGRLDLALQAMLVVRDLLTAEGLRTPGTVREQDIGLFGGLESDATQAPVADAFGPKGVSVALGQLLAQQGRLAESLPYLRAALVENAWRSVGWETPAQASEKRTVLVLLQTVEAELSRRDLADGGDGISFLTDEAATSDEDTPAAELTVEGIMDILVPIVDEMEKEQQQQQQQAREDQEQYLQSLEEEEEEEEE